jgi:DNA-binding MarR family transcriptional regulator
MSYDQKCEELADLFVDESYTGKGREKIVRTLAQSIQEHIEEWLEGFREEEKAVWIWEELNRHN